MLSRDHFYWGIFKKYIIAFSHIINDIHVIRTNASGVSVKDITVPITYATKSKLFSYLLRKNDKRVVRTTLPRISYIISGMEFDPARKMNSLNECLVETSTGTQTFQYIGLPYNFQIDLSIWSMYMDDLLQIIEQMATFFKPDYTLVVKEIEELDIERNVPAILNGITFDIENEFEDTDRIVRADASFTLKGFLYPPISDGDIIRNINIQFNEFDTQKVIETVKVDWDDLNQRTVTSIHTGQTYYEFNSEAAITTSSTGDISV